MKKAVLIMAGGSGSRLWPLSRKNRPKQSHRIFSNVSTFDNLLSIVRKHVPLERIYVTVGDSQYNYVSKTEILDGHILLQKQNKNTAPAILYGVNQIVKDHGDCIVAMLPSDHLIVEDELYIEAVLSACDSTSSYDSLVTIGTTPIYPSTGFGYIEVEEDAPGLKDVIAFKEKPNQIVANSYMDGRHLWNSGIYVSRTSFLMDAYKNNLPELYACLDDLDSFYERAPSVSLDYGITEKIKRIQVVVSRHTWMDMGTYDFLEHFIEKDNNGNIVQGNGVLMDTKSTSVISEKGQVVTFGVDDLLIVNTEEVMFVCNKNLIQKIGLLVDRLAENEGEYLL